MSPTSPIRRRFLPYEDSAAVANVVVDGAPNDATVLAISHWPGIPAPPGLAADLSAQMAFAYLDQLPDHPVAEVVTNNHFDQDGLAGLFALVSPEETDRHRDRGSGTRSRGGRGAREPSGTRWPPLLRPGVP